MIHRLKEVVLRKPEPRDADQLLAFKNDREIVGLLGGFSRGFSRKDIEEWVERHRIVPNEIIWTIARLDDDACIGHAGLYEIDHRVGSAEFALLIGDAGARGKGLGREITDRVVRYAFDELNLRRVELRLLATNERACRLYSAAGFREEGRLREAQFRNGGYVDVLLMGLLRAEYESR